MATTLDKAQAYDVAIQWRDSSGTLTTEYFSTVPRAGATGDVTSATFIDGRVKQIALQEWAFGPRRTRGPRAVGSGAIVLENGDGALDAWASRSVHMCAVTVRRLNLRAPTDAAQAEVIWDGYGELVEADDSVVTVYVRDKTFRFDKPALQTTYAGTNSLPNGIEGSAEMAGIRKPWLLGTGNRVPFLCVNTSKLIYQVDGVDGLRMNGTPPFTVYDSGVALTYSGTNHANQAAMEAAAAPAAGQYDRCTSLGCVRLGSTPTGRITGHLANYTAAAAGSPASGVTPTPKTSGAYGFGQEWHDLMAHVARKVDASINVTASTDLIPASSTGAMAAAMLYVTGEETYLDLLNALALASGGWWKYTGTTINIYRLARPETQTATITYREADMAASGGASLRKVVSGDDDRGIPAWRVVLKYARNAAVEVGTDLAAAVTAVDRSYRALEFYSAEADDSTVKTEWPASPEIVLHTPIADASPAGDEVARLQGLYNDLHQMYEFDVKVPLVGQDFADVGDYVSVEHSRFSLSGGRNFAVLGRRFNIDRGTCTFTVWGGLPTPP